MRHNASSEKPLDILLRTFRGLARDLDLELRDVRTIMDRAQHEGVEFFTKTLPLLAKSLESGIANGVFTLPTNFKRSSSGSALPALLGSQFKRVFSKDGLYLREDACCVAVYAIRQFCLFAYKCDLPRKQRLDDKVINAFLTSEQDLADADASAFHTHLVKVARDYITDVFSDYTSPTEGRHGPGVVSNSSYSRKWDKKLEPNLPLYSKFAKSFFFNDDHALFDGRGMYDDSLPSSVPRAKVILVPKDSRGPRLISCEPAEHMFIQQTIMDKMVRLVERHPYTKGHVNFTDQSINRELASVASKSKKFSTLDLKEASDRVHIDLVKSLYSDLNANGNPLLFDMLITRTQETVLPNGEIVELNKFAPMGSALCFPVLAMTVWSVAVSSLICAGYTEYTALNSVYVYGDDIICETEHVPFVVCALESVGLKINKGKSFINSDFAESCGMDSFKGEDVTPIKLRSICDFHSISPKSGPHLVGQKRKNSKNQSETSAIVKMVKTANQLQMDGLSQASEVLYSNVERYTGSLPLGHSRSPYLCRISKTRHIAEENYVKCPHLWKPRNNTLRYPDGCVLMGISVDPINVNHSTDVWTALWRKENSKKEYSFLDSLYPNHSWTYGLLPKPRSFKLRRKAFDHYSMMVP